MDDFLVPHKPRPRQRSNFPPNTHGRPLPSLLELASTARHHPPLREQMPAYQAEWPVGKGTGAHVQQPHVPGTQAQSPVGEAMLGHVGVGGGEDGALGATKGASRRRGGGMFMGVEGRRVRLWLRLRVLGIGSAVGDGGRRSRGGRRELA